VDPSRRDLCRSLGLLAIARTLPACRTTGPELADLACSPSAVEIGLFIADVAVGTVMKIELPTTNVFLCRDQEGIYALEAGCTHLGCDVAATGGGFQCPCHGATYDANGEHPTSPAPSSLPHYLVCATPGGVLVVDPEQPVDPATRYRV
jgi:Rieske Fe-S protein